MDAVVEDLGAQRGGRRVLEGVSFAARDGQMTGILGPNGAGKSTLLRIIAGIAAPQHGRVLLGGRPIDQWGTRERGQHLAFLEQEPVVSAPLSVREVVALGRLPHHRSWGWPGTTARDRQVVEAALHTAGVAPLADRTWGQLSGGERQRVQLARALAQEPDLILLDEPTNHLDVAAQISLLGHIKRLDATSIVALHDINLALRYCDTIVVLDRGRVVAHGLAAEVVTPQLIRDVYGVSATLLAHPVSGRPVVAYDDTEPDTPGEPA